MSSPDEYGKLIQSEVENGQLKNWILNFEKMEKYHVTQEFYA